jgi:hypothetical protein
VGRQAGLFDVDGAAEKLNGPAKTLSVNVRVGDMPYVKGKINTKSQ